MILTLTGPRPCCQIAPVVEYEGRYWCIGHALSLIGNEPAVVYDELERAR